MKNTIDRREFIKTAGIILNVSNYKFHWDVERTIRLIVSEFKLNVI